MRQQRLHRYRFPEIVLPSFPQDSLGSLLDYSGFLLPVYPPQDGGVRQQHPCGLRMVGAVETLDHSKRTLAFRFGLTTPSKAGMNGR